MTIKKLRHMGIVFILSIVMVIEGSVVMPIWAESDVADSGEAVTAELESQAEEESTEAEAADIGDATSDVQEAEADETPAVVDEASNEEANLNAIEGLLMSDGEGCTEEELEAESDADFDGYMYKLNDDATRSDIKEMEAAANELGEDESIDEVIEDEVYTADSLETISQVIDADKIEYIEPNYKAELMEVSDSQMATYIKNNGYTSTPNDELLQDWVYKGAKKDNSQINVPGAWKKNCYGQDWNDLETNIVVYIDTGIDLDNPDLNYNRIFNGYTYIDGEEKEGAEDTHGHGTFGTGIINGKMNNGMGITGFMPDLYIMPIKVVSKKSDGKDAASVSDMIKAIEKAIKEHANSINMSLGMEMYSSLLEDACNRACDAGIIICASAGNKGDNRLNYPASFSSVICVGSVEEGTNRSGNPALVHSSFSNYNSTVDVVAPGRNIIGVALTESSSVDGKKGYRYDSGTSFSTPMVTALAGMCKGIRKDMTTSEFRTLLAKTSGDLGTAGRDNYYGYGVVNFGRVAEALLDEHWGETPQSLAGATVKLSYTSKTYSGSYFKPTATVYKDGVKLIKDGDYRVSYSNNRSVGKATVKISGVGDYEGSVSKSFTIKPKGSYLKSVVKTRNSLDFRWYKRTTKMATTRITGYQIQLATNKSFTSGKKSYTVKGYSSYHKKFTKLRSKKYYYSRVRTYRTVNGVKYYSAWSKIERVKTL